jgi:hypothetical protein
LVNGHQLTLRLDKINKKLENQKIEKIAGENVRWRHLQDWKRKNFFFRILAQFSNKKH